MLLFYFLRWTHMRFLLFSFLISMNLYAQSTPDVHFMNDNECLQGNFEMRVSHQAALWGLLKNILRIEKKGCIISVLHESMKFSHKRWMIDVCREPIHIKYGVKSVDVFKKQVSCSDPKEAKKDSFCQQRKALIDVIQDDGLIFAAGEKEDISSEHGKAYCSLLLIKSYVDRELVFSRMRSYENILFPTVPLVDPSKIHTIPAQAPVDSAPPAKN